MSRAPSVTSDARWPLIVARHELNALAGSTKSFEILCRLRGMGGYARGAGFGGDAEAVPLIDARTQYQVNILVPRPSDENGAAAVASTKTLAPDDPQVLEAQGG